MAKAKDNIPKRNGGSVEWIVMKSLINAHEQTMMAMEHHAMTSLCEDRRLTDTELEACLRQARESHERALADIDAALEQLQSTEELIDDSE